MHYFSGKQKPTSKHIRLKTSYLDQIFKAEFKIIQSAAVLQKGFGQKEY